MANEIKLDPVKDKSDSVTPGTIGCSICHDRVPRGEFLNHMGARHPGWKPRK